MSMIQRVQDDNYNVVKKIRNRLLLFVHITQKNKRIKSNSTSFISIIAFRLKDFLILIFFSFFGVNISSAKLYNSKKRCVLLGCYIRHFSKGCQ